MTVKIIQGDCLTALSMLPAGSTHTCVTSPPYFGLRDYGHKDQIGLEETPDQYVAKLVDVFREVRRVLRPDGTLWLNLGDSYAGSGRGVWNVDDEIKKAAGTKERYRPRDVSSSQRLNAVAARGSRLPAGLHEQARQDGSVGRARVKPPKGLKQKDLIGIPWMVAFALRTDGWYLRQDIIWHKPNPMPHPNTDRCVSSHEYVFLLSKSKKYYFDYEAIKEPSVEPHRVRADRVGGNKGCITQHSPGGIYKQDGHGRRHAGFNDRYFGKEQGVTRNKRSVWTVTTKPFKGAHFATFPADLIEPCVLAGSPTGGFVLDPFGGAGTTGLVAQRHGRNAILLELNPEYAAMAEARIAANRTLEALS